jgi:hypothetical protein
MPTNSAFDAYFKDAAARIAQNKTITAPSNIWAGYKPVTGATTKKSDTGDSLAGNLGQGVLDFLSTGSYAVAGIGQRVGESFAKLGQGDTSNILADLTGVGLVQGVTQGIQQHRTWSDNLKAMGADEASAGGWGLALDIVLDPTWLIPGGAVAKGITGTARGIGVASRLTKEGVRLTPEIMQGVKAATEGAVRPGLRNLPQVSGEYGILSDVLKPSGQKISTVSSEGLQNFYQGIKQANIENYSEWSAARTAEKANHYMVGTFKVKRPEYRAALKAEKVVENIPTSSDLFKYTVPVGNVADQATDAVTKIVDSKATTQIVPNEIKDAGHAEDTAVAAVEKVKPVKETKVKATKEKVIKPVNETAPKNESVYAKSKRELAPARTEYQKANGFDTTDINYAAIKVSDQAPEMARVYDQLVSNPNDPAVISAYKKLVEETKQQYDYLTKKLGIKIEYIKGDPYNVKNAAGEMIPDSRLMMEDVLKNKRLQVRDSSIDFAEYPHPILSIEENNLFRAVHDFFGHAASGRGFAADGEEAAWVSHSSMFTPEARRAMTTETRGQNSYYNFFDPKRKMFAPQKAALFPEEYTLLPAELDIVTGQALTTNALFGRLTSALSLYADNILDDLTLVKTPIKGSVLYTPEQLTKIKNMVDEIVPTATYVKGSLEHTELKSHLIEIIKKLESALPETVAFITKPTDPVVLKLLQQTLDESVDVTPLLKELASTEGKTLTPPPPFKATKWEAKKGKPEFKIETLTTYFPNDELLADPKKLGIAMGTTPVAKAKIYARKGETAQQAYERYQATIWEDFRARNIDNLKTVEAKQKADWDAKYQQPNSEMFTESATGELVGLGKLPENLPMSVLTGSFNGKPMSTLGKMLENIDSMIKNSKLSPYITRFLSSNFRNTVARINKIGVKTVDMTEAEFNAAASKLLSTGIVKSFADAKVAVGGKAEDLRKLGAKPQMKIYIHNRDDLRKISKTGKGQFKPLLRRDPTTGAPVDKNGNIVTEREAAKVDVSNTSGASDNFVGLRGTPVPTMGRITDTGTDFTGRSGKAGSAWSEQSGVGKQQLADLQAVREAIGNIGTGIKAKEFIAMPEQASLLSNVMTSIGIKVADNLAPEAVFKMFQKEALPAFNDMVKKIESAAKNEAVIYQARAVFNKSIEENLTLMKTIEALDPGEVQRSVVKFTEDAVNLVDEFCATRFDVIGGPKTTGTEFLQQITQGGISKGAKTGDIRETLAGEIYPNDLSKAVQKSRY